MRRNYIDLANVPITAGDILIILDDDNPEISLTIKVRNVEDKPEFSHRLVTGLVVAMSEKIDGVDVGKEIPLEISRHVPTRGILIKSVDADTTLSYIEKQETIISAIIDFLNQRVAQHYRATYNEIITFLTTAGYLDAQKPYEVNKRYLTQLCRQHEIYIRLSGKFLTYTGRPFTLGNPNEIVRQDPVQKRVKWGKLMQGLRLVFEALGYKIDD
jgi:hypothetical protein